MGDAMNEELSMIVKGGTVATAAGMVRADIGISGERIAVIAPDLDIRRSRRVIDATGKLVLPGLVDVHTHPVYADDMGGISVTAACGGVTTMIHYAYAKPGMKLGETIRRFRDEGCDKSLLDFALHGGLFDVENQLEEVPAAFVQGVTSFKVFMTYAKLRWMTDDYWLTALLDVVGQEQGLVAVHAENGLATDYLEDKYLREGASPAETFTKMRPDVLEAEAVNRAMSIAHVMKCALYVPHVSAAACLEPLRQAHRRGWSVYGETCPQYLALTDETTRRFGPQAKIGPPLRTQEDIGALWWGLADGTLCVIGSDHAPKPKKPTDDFFAAPYGSPQLETMLPVVYDAGVNSGKMSVPQMVKAMCETPARLFGLYPAKGDLQVGSDADLVVFDPTFRHTLRAETQHSGAGFSLYEGREVTGIPVLTMQRGRVIVENGNVVTKPGIGRFLPTHTAHLYGDLRPAAAVV
jgi:dihydropyrimidinase